MSLGRVLLRPDHRQGGSLPRPLHRKVAADPHLVNPFGVPLATLGDEARHAGKSAVTRAVQGQAASSQHLEQRRNRRLGSYTTSRTAPAGTPARARHASEVCATPLRRLIHTTGCEGRGFTPRTPRVHQPVFESPLLGLEVRRNAGNVRYLIALW